MGLNIPEVPEYFPYDAGGLYYFEVRQDGAVSPVLCDAASRVREGENTCLSAYRRAKSGETTLYVAGLVNSYGKIGVYWVKDLEAFADRIGIVRQSDHVHDVQWKLSDWQSDSKGYVYVDVHFACCCKIGRENFRTIAAELRQQRGWNVVLSSPPQGSGSSARLKVSKCTLK